MKFGKQIQKKQLEIPEYASSFVDYKALKKLIKELKNSPIARPNSHPAENINLNDTQSALQANKAPFFFRLDRELDKVNNFYTVKELESKVRLKVLTDKQKSMRLRHPVISKTSTQYITLEQGFQDFIRDLSKLQQFIEINATAFAKILKKWDKTSKSQTKELYLSRAIEVQPCFNHDVISELSDQANTSLLDCAAWAEGETTQFGSIPDTPFLPTPRLEQDEADSDAVDAVNNGDVEGLKSLMSHLESSSNASERITKAFLTAVSQGSEDCLRLLLESNQVDLHRQDEINDRNCLHKAAMTGRLLFLRIGLAAGVDPTRLDAYGRIPLHYACMNGHFELIQDLIEARSETIEVADLDKFTPLIHAIGHGHLACVERILSFSARVDAVNLGDHVPLNLACQHGSLAIVELLLRGAPKIVPDAEGLYPQHLVARFGQDPQLFLLLRDYGADLDQPDKLYWWTPLFHAASEGRTKCLQRLLECGVNAAVTDEKGMSARYYATWEGHMECMRILAAAVSNKVADRLPRNLAPMNSHMNNNAPAQSEEVELIPDLSLPPPIIPTRRYGHNFLQSKTTVVITFEDTDGDAVKFYDRSKYPAARLTVSPRSSDILPRNILLPIQDENRSVSFEMDSLEIFSVDFDVYHTFGKKVVAKGSVPPDIFMSSTSSSGQHYVALLDPRLRSVGQIRFKFQVIKPFAGAPLNMTPFATYWKATSQVDSQPSSLVTGSSLKGEYVRLFIQISRDGIPILYPQWTIDCGGVQMPVIGLTYKQFQNLPKSKPASARYTDRMNPDLAAVHRDLAFTHGSLDDALTLLPPETNIELHVLYPNEEQEEELWLGPSRSINDFADALLEVVFQHARESREQMGDFMRSIVFTSYNKDICTALNWKQPNYPVMLCNDLGATSEPSRMPNAAEQVSSSGQSTMSLKEAVRIAQGNNFMGLVCRSQILNTIPALIESIKVAGLVLVSDASDAEDPISKGGGAGRNPAAPAFAEVPEGIDGILQQNGVLRFRETLEI